jgi:hypothetical protein
LPTGLVVKNGSKIRCFTSSLIPVPLSAILTNICVLFGETRLEMRLSQEERQYLQNLVSTGKAAAYKIKHANILLNIDVNGQGWTDEKAAAANSSHRNTVANLRERLVKEGIESALNRKPSKTPPRQMIIDGGGSKTNRLALWRTTC